MRRFYCSGAADIIDGEILLKDKQAHHIKNVLRLKEGDRIAIFDGTGRQYNCIITDIKTRGVKAHIITSEFSLSKESLYKVTLAQAIPNRPAKMSFIIEKATELGVDGIIPVSAYRSIIKLDQRQVVLRRQKWQRLASEVARQCGRPGVPDVGEVVPLEQAVSVLAGKELKLFPCIDNDAIPLEKAIKDIARPNTIALFIGPEGDFAPSEIKIARDKGFKIVSLGERVLRTETAGLYVLSILDYLLG